MPRIAEPVPPYEDVPNRKRWTRRECEVLLEMGMLEARDELIEGQIIIRPRYTPQHSAAIVLLRSWLTGVFGSLFVQARAPVLVAPRERDANDPEPDAAVTALPSSEYVDRHPSPDELLLVAEVSDTTLRFDRIAKAALYARAGIVEYWIVDITGRQLFVHRQPRPEGYADITVYGEEEPVAGLARPNDAVRVAELLPPLP